MIFNDIIKLILKVPFYSHVHMKLKTLLSKKNVRDVITANYVH